MDNTLKGMNNIEEIRGSRDVSLRTTSLSRWHGEEQVIDYGVIMICRRGSAVLKVNFSVWRLSPGSVITLFPGDTIVMTEGSTDFCVEALQYSASLPREASLQLEQTVYSHLRTDRCRTESPVLTKIIDSMFALLGVYFAQPECICLDQLVMLQLKAFFLGFHDYMYRSPGERIGEEGSPRVRELFSRFMMEMESRYRQSRDVGYYASLLHITPKYLNLITRRVSGHTAKTLIDQYVILQLKLSLCSEGKSAKQLAWDYHFSDLSFFCRYFKQHTGMTPMQFVKSKNGGAAAEL